MNHQPHQHEPLKPWQAINIIASRQKNASDRFTSKHNARKADLELKERFSGDMGSFMAAHLDNKLFDDKQSKRDNLIKSLTLAVESGAIDSLMSASDAEYARALIAGGSHIPMGEAIALITNFMAKTCLFWLLSLITSNVEKLEPKEESADSSLVEWDLIEKTPQYIAQKPPSISFIKFG